MKVWILDKWGKASTIQEPTKLSIERDKDTLNCGINLTLDGDVITVSSYSAILIEPVAPNRFRIVRGKQ